MPRHSKVVLLSEKDKKKYAGKWVAVRSFEDNTVLASAKEPDKKFFERARRKQKDCVFFYIFKAGELFMFKVLKVKGLF